MRTSLLSISVMAATLVLAGCDSSNHSATPPPPEPVLPSYDFAAVDARFQQFLDESPVFDGISFTLVDLDQGVVHEAALGDHTLDTVVMLASTSKVPFVSLLMAMDGDDSLNFDIEASIDNYLPWDGVYGDRTSAQLVSNTSGIPGLDALGVYGIHLCQFSPDVQVSDCAQVLYANELPGSLPAGTGFSYGGSAWQIGAGVVEQVTNSTMNQAFDNYIAGPCELEVFTYGNPWSELTAWNGSPDSLIGKTNAHAEGGAITNLGDYAKILLMHLNGGKCGDNQVIAESAVSFMQVDRAGEFGTPYGMGWWIETNEDGSAPTVYTDPGAFGAISWLDMERQIGGYVAIDDYTRIDSGAPIALVREEIIALVAQAVDEARAAVE